MSNFIDIHSHILPGFDDGVSSYEEAIEVLRIAYQDGVSHIVATPHHVTGIMYQNPDEIISAIQKLQLKIDDLGIPIKIFPGMEIRICSELPDWVETEEVLKIDCSTDYILVEFPFLELPSYASQICFDLRLMGLKPVIAHPERNSDIIKNPLLLEEFVNMDCLIQLTSSSIIGKEGRSAQKISFDLIKAGLAHIVASDAHAPHHRVPNFSQAYKEVIKQAGREYTDELFFVNPARILNLL